MLCRDTGSRQWGRHQGLWSTRSSSEVACCSPVGRAVRADPGLQSPRGALDPLLKSVSHRSLCHVFLFHFLITLRKGQE